VLALEAHAKELGSSLAELTGGKKAWKSSRPDVPKDCHPENAAVTLSGRRRMPRWFGALVEAGMPTESMAL
jgi:DNA-binding protein H-NS